MFDHFFLALQQYPELYLGSLFVVGALVGSFLNVVIYRLPVMMQREWRAECREFLELPAEEEQGRFNLSVPRSRCGNCGHRITALENIPIISYLVLRGHCSECGVRLSLQYPLVELFTALLSMVVGWHFGVSLQALAALVLTWSLIAASGIDIGHKLLPDSITLPLLWLGVLLSLFDLFIPLEQSVVGVMVGYLSLWSVFMLFKLVTGKEGMGYGDFKMLAMLGAWLGWQPLLVGVMTASLVGAIVGITMIVARINQRGTQIPFGPYLAAAGWLTLLWGEPMLAYYLNLFNF